MVDICRILSPHDAASHSDLPAQGARVSSRGLALVHIEFLTLHELGACVFTRPVAHTAALRFLFPRVVLHVYGAAEEGRRGNLVSHAEAFTEAAAVRWAQQPQCGLVACGGESPERQLVWSLKMQPAACAMCIEEMPSEFVAGTLMLPLLCPRSCTDIFLFQKLGQQQSRRYDAAILRRQVLHSHETRRVDGAYDAAAEAFLLCQACRHKGVSEDVVAAVAYLAGGMLPERLA